MPLSSTDVVGSAAGVQTTLALWLGTDKDFAFHIKNAALTASTDITGWALSFMVKARLGDTDVAALITKTTGAGITIAGLFSGTVANNVQRATVTLTDTNSASLTPGLAHWELKRTDDGFESVLAYGRIDLKSSVHAP